MRKIYWAVPFALTGILFYLKANNHPKTNAVTWFVYKANGEPTTEKLCSPDNWQSGDTTKTVTPYCTIKFDTAKR